jgi:hypothetical protein
MAQYWIDVEDDPDIIDADIDEVLQVLENVELMLGHDLEVLKNVELLLGHDTKDENDVGESHDIMVVDNAEVLLAVICFLKHNSTCKLFSTKDAALLDKYGRLLRAHRLARPKSSPTLFSSPPLRLQKAEWREPARSECTE